MKTIKAAFKWLMSHWGWGWHGHDESKLKYKRISGHRQAVKDYCEEWGLTRKQAKKHTRRANATKANWKKERKRKGKL